MRKQLPIILTLLMLSTLPAFAQTVTGTVTSLEDGEPLPGVSVLVKGTTTGTSTDANGKYTLNIADLQAATLVFSFVGFTSEEVVLGGRTVLDMSLTPDIKQLSEVVVTALGIQRETKSLGYAVTEVEGSELQITREPSFVNALAGKVAGLVVNTGTNGAGSASKVTIRGNASFGNNQPLYVVDGLPIDNTFRGTVDDGGAVWGGTDPGDGLANLNPDDIESISVLKGVSAAALYGNRAQGGVILITTKKGRKGQGLGISFNSNTVLEQMIPYDDYQDVYGVGLFGTLPAPTASDFRYALAWGPKFSDVETFTDFDGVVRPYVHQSTKENFKRFYDIGVSTTNSLAISGASDKSTYRLSLSHTYNESPSPGNSDMKRYNMTFRGTTDIGEKLHADYKIDLSRTDRIGKNLLRGDGRGAVGRVFSRMSNTMNIDLMRQKNESGNYIYSGYVNPWPGIELVQADDYRDRMIALTKLTYDITNTLSATVQGSVDVSNVDDILFVNPNSFSDNSGLLNQTKQEIEEDNVLAMLSYNKDLSDFSMSVNVGTQHRFYKNSSLNVVGRNFVLDDLLDWSNIPALSGSSPNTSISSPDIQKKVNSVFGSAQFGYKDLVFLELTGRNDWATSLSSIRKGFYDNSLFYPSANLSFAFTDVINVFPNTLSFGKLRASWGQTGSDFDAHLTDLTFLIEDSNNGVDNATINGSTLPPTNIKPETTTEIEIGTQLNFFADRLSVDFAFYNRKTTDFLLSSAVSQSTGFSSVYLNAGSMRNRGIELLITGFPVKTKEFSWEVSVNLARNKNKVLELTEELKETGIQHYEVVRSLPGYPMGSIFGTPIRRGPNGEIIYRQVDSDGDNINDAVVYERGQVTYDANGNPLRDANNAIIVDNQVYLGTGNPDFTAGIYNTFRYKGFSFSALIDGQFGGSIFSDTHKWASYFGLTQESLVGREGDYVPVGLINSSGNDNNPVYVQNNLPLDPLDQYTGTGFNITEMHTFDNSFIKFRQVTLGYRFSSALLGKLPFRSVTVSLIGRNLFYIRKDVPIVDPNSADTIGNGFGFETNGLPSSRTYGFNINFEL